jgi:hypothetical protein
LIPLAVDLNNAGTDVAIVAAPTIAILVSSWFARRDARAVAKASTDAAALVVKVAEQNKIDATRAQEATAKAEISAAKAQKATIDAARHLVEAARTSAPILNSIKETGEATHQLVNNDRSIDKTNIARLTRLIAKLLPNDLEAEAAAVEAQNEANRYPKPESKTS